MTVAAIDGCPGRVYSTAAPLGSGASAIPVYLHKSNFFATSGGRRRAGGAGCMDGHVAAAMAAAHRLPSLARIEGGGGGVRAIRAQTPTDKYLVPVGRGARPRPLRPPPTPACPPSLPLPHAPPPLPHGRPA